MATQKSVIDIDGAEAVSRVLLGLMNDFPGLGNQKILFSTLSETSGIGFFPTSGAALLSNTEDVTGHVKQVCAYPFNVIYRAAPKSEVQRIKIKEFLDGLGRWLERQPVTINGETHQLSQYPSCTPTVVDSEFNPLGTSTGDTIVWKHSVLSGGERVIKSINRTNPGHLNAVYQDGIEDWIISATLRYENEFYR